MESSRNGIAPQPLRAGKGVNMLIYGVPGAGKTRLIGSAPKTLIIRPPTDHTDSIEDASQVKELVVSDWSGMLEVFQWGQQGGFKDFDWVWLDSISLFQEMGLDDVFQDAIARKPSRAEYGPDKGEYGVNIDRLGRWVRDMVALADKGMFNFGITAHPAELEDPISGDMFWAPYVQGRNMTHKVCGYMNVVAYLSVVRKEGKPTQRLLLTDADGFVGKDQLDCFPELKSGRHGIIDPTMPKVISAIKKVRKAPKPAGRKRPARKTRASR